VTPIDQCAFYPLLEGGRNTASGLPQRKGERVEQKVRIANRIDG